MSKHLPYEILFIHANGEAKTVVQFARSAYEACTNLKSRNSPLIKQVIRADVYREENPRVIL